MKRYFRIISASIGKRSHNHQSSEDDEGMLLVRHTKICVFITVVSHFKEETVL